MASKASMEYMCPRCHYSTRYRSHYIEHLARKRECEPMFSDTAIDIISKELQDSQVVKPHSCKHCGARYSHLSSLHRHTSTHKVDVVAHQAEPPTQYQTPNHMEHNVSNCSNIYTVTNNVTNITNNITNNIVNNITNNIVNYNIQNVTLNILPFGKEDIGHVETDHDFLTHCLSNVLGNGIPDIVKKIFFNEDVPQNHNVSVKKVRAPATMMVLVQNGTDTPKWVESNMTDTLDKMIEKSSSVLIKHNDNVYFISNDSEQRDVTVENISQVRSKRRGVYRKIRDQVLNVAKTPSSFQQQQQQIS